MTDTRYIPLASLLIDIECELRRAGLWADAPPPPQAFDSVEPFCIDTMAFHQWLQFLFLPRMQELLEARAGLPDECRLSPMGEASWGGQAATRPLIAVLQRFDAVFNGSFDAPV